MATIREQTRLALYGKLNVSGVTSLVGTRIYHGIAPDEATYPFIVFNCQAPGNVAYTMSGAVAEQADLWSIRAVTTADDSTSASPQELADSILSAALTAIGTSLSLSSNTNQWCRRFADIPETVENVNDRLVWQHGFLLRVSND